MLRKSVLRRQYLRKFDTMCKQTTYNKDRQKSGELLLTSGTASQYPDNSASRPFLRRQLNCTPTEKKENKKSPLRIFENFLLAHWAHLTLPPTAQTNRRGQSQKSPIILHTIKKDNYLEK